MKPTKMKTIIMKTSIVCSIILCVVACTNKVAAQIKPYNENVTVIGNFQPSLSDANKLNTQIQAIQHRLAEEAFLKEEAAEQIVTLWITALGWEIEEPDDIFEIVWQRGYSDQ